MGARADTTTSLEALQAWEDLLHRSSVEEAATTTTSMATNMDLPAVEDLVRSLVSSLVVEATTTTSNILATTTMDRREALADLQAWPVHSWEAEALPTTTSLADSTDRTRTTATVEAAGLTEATTSSNMGLTKATVAAVAEASSAASWVETSTTVAPADTVTRQEGAPAAPTLALRRPAHTSPRDSRTTANLAKDTALTVDLRHPIHTSLRDNQTTVSLVKGTAPTVAQHLRALHHSLDPTIRLVETNHMDNNPTADHHRADLEDTSSPAPTVDPLSSMVAMTKAVTALEVTTSNREVMANPKADTVDTRLLLGATEAVDTSNSMATAATEDDFCRAFFLDIET